MAWKFIPTAETRAALSKPLEDFLINYPIENDLRFVKNKKIIRKVLIEEENREDLVFFDIIYGDFSQHPREEYNYGSEDFEPYDRFNPISEFEEEELGPPANCRFCGKPIRQRIDGRGCCSSPECRNKIFIKQRREKLSVRKTTRDRANIENPVRCHNCNGILPETARPNQKFCGLNCRVAFHRKKKISS